MSRIKLKKSRSQNAKTQFENAKNSRKYLRKLSCLNIDMKSPDTNSNHVPSKKSSKRFDHSFLAIWKRQIYKPLSRILYNMMAKRNVDISANPLPKQTSNV